MSTTDGPTTDRPTTDRPTTDGPTTDGPIKEAPTTLDDAVAEPDAAAADAARRHQAALAKPPGSLGRLEDLGVWAAAVQGRCPPAPFERARVLVFAGDHGIAAAGVSAYPAEVTGQTVRNILAGGAAVNALARAAGASVRVVDLAVDADTTDEVCQYKVRRGSGRIDREDALSPEQTRQAFDAGTRIADDEIDQGADLLIAGHVGVANTTPASTIVAALCGAEPVAVIGRGSGIDDDTWMRKLSAIRDALRRVRGRVSPLTLLQVAGSADLAAMTGFLAQAAVRRTPVLLDGLVSTAAALVAQQATPAAPQWWLASHRSPEPAHALALSSLDLDPLLDLGVRLGEGAGALLALPLLNAAVHAMAEMATFDAAQRSP